MLPGPCKTALPRRARVLVLGRWPFCPYEPWSGRQGHPGCRGDLALAWPLPQPVCSPKQALLMAWSAAGLARSLAIGTWSAICRAMARECTASGLARARHHTSHRQVLCSPGSRCSVLPAPGAEVIAAVPADRFRSQSGCQASKERPVASSKREGWQLRPVNAGGLTVTARWASPSRAGFVDNQMGDGAECEVVDHFETLHSWQSRASISSRPGLSRALAAERSAGPGAGDVQLTGRVVSDSAVAKPL